MVEPLAVASWLTPTSLFVLLNVVIGFIAITSILASRKSDHPSPEYHQQHHQYQINHHQESTKTLLRAPSLFSRVTSFNFSNQYSYGSSSLDESHSYQVDDHSPSFFSRMTSFNRSVEPEIHNRQSEEIEQAPSLIARMTSFNRFSVNKSEESEIIPRTKDENHPPIARAPSLLSRMASFNLSLHRSTEKDSSTSETPVPAVEAHEQHVTRSATELKKKKKKIPLAENKMKKSSSEKAGKEMEMASSGQEEVDAKADDFINKFKQQLRLQRLDSLLRYRNSA